MHASCMRMSTRKCPYMQRIITLILLKLKMEIHPKSELQGTNNSLWKADPWVGLKWHIKGRLYAGSEKKEVEGTWRLEDVEFA